LFDNDLRVRAGLASSLAFYKVGNAAIHQIFGNRPLIRDRPDAAPLNCTVRTLLDYLIVIGESVNPRECRITPPGQFSYVLYEQPRMGRLDLIRRLAEADAKGNGDDKHH
jgi:hypothetical protein